MDAEGLLVPIIGLGIAGAMIGGGRRRKTTTTTRRKGGTKTTTTTYGRTGLFGDNWL